MAYIGQSIKNGTFSVLDTSGNTYNGSNTTFSLGTQVGSAAQLLVSHDGVIQKPGTDYTLATGGTQITFTTAPASGASIFIVEISGAVGGPMNRDLNGEELILDVDGDSSIHADTDDQIDFKTGGTDRLKVQSTSGNNVVVSDGLTLSDGNITFSGSGHGIHLGVTSATAANLLDDYEEGTFDFTLQGGGGNPTVSYNERAGTYTKIGNRVYINGVVYPSAISGGSGQVRFSGLPFTTDQKGVGAVIFDRVRITNASAAYPTTVAVVAEQDTTYVTLNEMNDNSDETRGTVNIDDLASNAYIAFSLQYRTAS